MTSADGAENWSDNIDLQPGRNPNSSRSLHRNMPLSTDKTNTVVLHQWAEARPSTPSKRHQTETDNWDDDFQDAPESPVRHRPNDSSPKSRRSKPRQAALEAEPENWDDDFEEDNHAPPSTQKSMAWESSDEEEEFGFADREEDRTVTSRSRRGMFSTISPDESPPPPVPPIPSAFMNGSHDPSPFPRSPTASVFSVPVSGRDSVAAYSSTAHLALRPTQSGSSLGMLPPSPPIHQARDRRRLRKKSRPANVEPNVYELQDIPPLRPKTPEQRPLPETFTSLDDPLPQEILSSAGKSSLVSRIGSVGRKWGATRKKRASTGPDELLPLGQKVQHYSRPQSMAITPSPPVSNGGGWFFRHGGVAEAAGSGSPPHQASLAPPLKHEKSVDRLLALVGFESTDTPTRKTQQIRHALPADLTSSDHDGSPRRPTSMQFSSSSRSSSRPRGQRHTSYGQTSGRRTPSSRSSSVARSASASIDDVSTSRLHRAAMQRVHDDNIKTPRKGRKSTERDVGDTSFMRSMRRLSLRGSQKHPQSTPAGSDTNDPVRPSTSTTATAVPMLPPDFSDDTTPRPPSRVLGRASMDKSLLPPIELQPPSPPRQLSGLALSQSEPSPGPTGIDVLLAPLTSSASAPNASIQSTLTKLPASPPQSASLGRSTHPPKDKEDANGVPRRNSLGDLKIPARISQAQIGLRRDLVMVRDFAVSVEQLKGLRITYDSLLLEMQALLLRSVPSDEMKPRAVSPSLFGLPRPGRARSSTNPQTSSNRNAAEMHRQLATTYRTIEAKYALSWECAELLVELGGGPTASQPSVSSIHTLEQSTSTITQSASLYPDMRKSRERAVTLAGDESKPQIPMVASAPSTSGVTWRASTGRHDLSQRQLLLLRDMLNQADSSLPTLIDTRISEEAINRQWRWGDAMSSTMTLPSEESSQHDLNTTAVDAQTPLKKRKSTRLGMRGLRDMLKSLRKSYTQTYGHPPLPTQPALPSDISSSSNSVAVTAESSSNLPKERTQSVQRRRAKTSAGPESIRSLRDTHPNSPYVTSASAAHRSSPRRPSLASIFRLGQKSAKSVASKSSTHAASTRELSAEEVDKTGSSSSCYVSSVAHTEEEDWDKVESSSEVDVMAHISLSLATVRGPQSRSPYATYGLPQVPTTPGRVPPNPNASRSSIWESSGQAVSRPMQSPSSGNVSQSYSRSTKLSDVKEIVEKDGHDAQQPHHRRSLSKGKKRASGAPSPTAKRPMSRGGRKSVGTGSLRSQLPSSPSHSHLPDFDNPAFSESPLSLAMTPENIRPLLDNAREVHARCTECIAELKQLLFTGANISTVLS
ncbi:hypothetical protein BDW22DRAFT_1362572 [Trametopsis cervina]|nr:hypothetical protein BDW22DRAFT_1362572 [Trametopsis cervina]